MTKEMNKLFECVFVVWPLIHVPNFLQAYRFTLCKICGTCFGFCFNMPHFLADHTKDKLSMYPFLNVLTHNKTTFYQSCFHHNYFNLDKSRPFFLCRYYLSTLSEDKEKYILIRERGVVIQLFAMHIHIMCVMQ